jgi:hypothetical protein
MRTALLIGLALAALALSSRADNSGSWCAHYRNAGNNCDFQSFRECQVSVSELGGFCTRR